MVVVKVVYHTYILIYLWRWLDDSPPPPWTATGGERGILFAPNREGGRGAEAVLTTEEGGAGWLYYIHPHT